MEKTTVLSTNKLGPVNKKDKIANKLDDMWKPQNKSNNENKKLVVKLETNGKEKRKLLLKLESYSADVHSNNYNLISELLKEFFNNNNDLK